MKEKIRHMIAEKVVRKGFTKLMIENLAKSGKLTENVQNYYLDQLSALDKEIEVLEKALKMLN